MAHNPLHNYVRTYRRRFGFSQAEIAMLLGTKSAKTTSRHENFARLPAVGTIWAYEVLFGVASHELFADSYHLVRTGVEARAKRMIKQLSAEPVDARTERKLEFLRAIVDPEFNQATQSA